MKKNIDVFSNIGVYSAIGFIVFSVIPYAISGKHIFSGLMLISFIVLLCARKIKIRIKNFVDLSLIGLVLVCLISSSLGPYPIESLDVFRKDTLPFFVAFVLLSSQLENKNKAVEIANAALWALLFGFFIKESLAVYDAVVHDFYSVYEANSRETPKYLDFFATDSIFYLPFLLAVAFSRKNRFYEKIATQIAAIVAMVFVVLSGSRTPFALMLFTVVLFLLNRFWVYKKKIIFGVVVLSIFVGLAKPYVTNISLARLYTVFSVDTFKFGIDQSVSDRKAIAMAVWEVSKERAFLGHGQGWKKLPRVAKKNGFMDSWRQSNYPIDAMKLNYFEFGEGRVNPHNFYLQIIFEVGILGLFFYMALLITVLASGLKGLAVKIHGGRFGMSGDDLALCAYVLVTFASGVSGGVWLPSTLLVALLLAKCNYE